MTSKNFVFVLSCLFAFLPQDQSSSTEKHLDSPRAELPEQYGLNGSNTLAISLHDHANGVDILCRFYGERIRKGGTKLTRILFRFPKGKKVLNIADCREILIDRHAYPKGTVDCLSGYLVVNREAKKVEFDCIVFDKDDWNRFAWNGVWNMTIEPNMDIEKIVENMK